MTQLELDPGLAPFFEVRTVKSGTTHTVTVLGAWDLAAEAGVDEAIQAALRQRPEILVVDLGEAEFIASTGVNCLLRLHCQAAALGVRLVIVPAPALVQRVFAVCGVDRLLPFVGQAC